ncbi:hypothetical protein PSP31121_05567 [Pandoraea sputorum]|uniref:Uncharacterized protein n=1 Tax=Pandoraea sputorum TaxID=93222 RepID=A0A5E5BJP9_9BURK|nr:hypothetical protein PSP31121_05567 [Pandoraea sputorum]
MTLPAPSQASRGKNTEWRTVAWGRPSTQSEEDVIHARQQRSATSFETYFARHPLAEKLIRAEEANTPSHGPSALGGERCLLECLGNATGIDGLSPWSACRHDGTPIISSCPVRTGNLKGARAGAKWLLGFV